MTTWTKQAPPTDSLFPLLTEASLELLTEAGLTILAFPDDYLWGPESDPSTTWTRVFPP